jgi:DNA-binding NarL/FixJ family response regulator
MTKPLSALIIAQPGQLRDGLRMLLQAIPQVYISQTDDCPSALLLDTCYAPSLVLLDFDLIQNQDTIQAITARWPQSRYIVLVADEQQYHLARHAIADITLLKGILASRLFLIIEELLS